MWAFTTRLQVQNLNIRVSKTRCLSMPCLVLKGWPWTKVCRQLRSTGDDLPSPFTSKIDTTFPKGVAFADWLVNVGASPTRGVISILGGQFSVRKPHPPETQQWIYTDENPGDDSKLAVEYMTMNTPVERD